MYEPWMRERCNAVHHLLDMMMVWVWLVVPAQQHSARKFSNKL
jgi:hypothetical protein